MAQALGPLREQVVFVGGCATGLLIDNPKLMDVRPTEDVDAIVEVASLASYHRFAERLAQRGFRQRWRKTRRRCQLPWPEALKRLLERNRQRRMSSPKRSDATPA
jgi:hypothetical protein